MSYDMMWREDRDRPEHRFRLNNWGMGLFRSAMSQTGMTFPSSLPEWPALADYGTTSDLVWAVDVPEERPDVRPTPEEAGRARAYLAREHEVRVHNPGTGDGIPVHKFCSNDNWIVTPGECRRAVAIYRAWEARNGREELAGLLDDGEERIDVGVWDRWIAFLEDAADHGGVEVY